ncbi:MAG: HAD family hydrolase [Nitrospira sp.]
MSKLDAVIFDLDDTLYPERSFVLSGFHAVAKWVEHTLAIPEEKTARELEAMYRQGVRGHTFRLWLEQQAVDGQRDELVQQMVAVYREHEPILTLFDGIPELLSDVGQRCKLGLITDGYLTVQKRKWESLHLDDAFHTVVFSDMFGRQHWKPSCVPFEAALRTLQIAPEAALYVGDNPAKDFLGARQLGMKTIRFRSFGGEYALAEPQSSRHAPDVTVDNVQCLRAYLFNL